MAGKAGVADEVDEFLEALLVDVIPVEDLRKDAGQDRVGLHHLVHGIVEEFADTARRAQRVLGEVVPTGGRRNPENVLTDVLVPVVEESGAALLGDVGQALGDLGAPLSEGVGDVLEEDQAEDELLVLGCVHGAAELVRGLPQDVLDLLGAGRAGQLALACGCSLAWRHWSSSLCLLVENALVAVTGGGSGAVDGQGAVGETSDRQAAYLGECLVLRAQQLLPSFDVGEQGVESLNVR